MTAGGTLKLFIEESNKRQVLKNVTQRLNALKEITSLLPLSLLLNLSIQDFIGTYLGASKKRFMLELGQDLR